jgi:anti-sigma B factor antagonist
MVGADKATVVVVQQEANGRSAAIVRAAGELDMITVPELREQLFAQLDQRHHVVLDLSRVTFFSSIALQVLAEAHDEAAARGASLHITGSGSRPVRRPLEITGLDRVLVISSVPAAALATQLLDGAAS